MGKIRQRESQKMSGQEDTCFMGKSGRKGLVGRDPQGGIKEETTPFKAKGAMDAETSHSNC